MPSQQPATRKRKGPPLDQVRVDCFMLADGASESAGKLYILGGGWNQLNVPGPDVMSPPIALAIRIVVPWNETNQEMTAHLQLEDEDRRPLFSESPAIVFNVGRPPSVMPGAEQPVPFAFTIPGMPFQRKGAYAFTLTLGERELARVKFQVNFTGQS